MCRMGSFSSSFSLFWPYVPPLALRTALARGQPDDQTETFLRHFILLKLRLFCHRCDCKRAANGGTFARRFFCKQLPAYTTTCLLARQDPRKRMKSCCWTFCHFALLLTCWIKNRLERMIPAPDAEFLSQRVWQLDFELKLGQCRISDMETGWRKKPFLQYVLPKLATLLRFVRGALEAVGVEDPRRAGLQEWSLSNISTLSTIPRSLILFCLHIILRPAGPSYIQRALEILTRTWNTLKQHWWWCTSHTCSAHWVQMQCNCRVQQKHATPCYTMSGIKPRCTRIWRTALLYWRVRCQDRNAAWISKPRLLFLI